MVPQEGFDEEKDFRIALVARRRELFTVHVQDSDFRLWNLSTNYVPMRSN